MHLRSVIIFFCRYGNLAPLSYQTIFHAITLKPHCQNLPNIKLVAGISTDLSVYRVDKFFSRRSFAHCGIV
jgi:hypothetical protein